MQTKKPLSLLKVYQLIEPGPVVMLTTAYKGKQNIMTMAWLTMIGFKPPLIACVLGKKKYSFAALKKTKECVINIPTVELIETVMGVGNTTGSEIDKFKKFELTPEPATLVDAPIIKECYASLECKVVDTKMVSKYNMFILEVVKAWITPRKKRARTIHHIGSGVFVVDGEIIKARFKKK